eukprot:TRINITY_DN12006_c0_g1_i3.p1 TRINITY_DN12006_c0_g1~~TRINITY_DN12006_c0_g1_i3.p1  ORF type:complete len:192 (-),score=25.09 TRINITY_DN12006_c0_g1_i3:9-584(-)
MLNVERIGKLRLGPHIWGSNFSRASKQQLLSSFTGLHPISISHLLTLTAPRLPSEPANPDGHLYTSDWIRDALTSVYGAWAIARFEAYFASGSLAKAQRPRVVLHTTDWSQYCESQTRYGSDHPVMLALLQLVAALVVGVDQVIYHTINEEGQRVYQRAYDLLLQLISRLPRAVHISDVIELIAGLKLKWT